MTAVPKGYASHSAGRWHPAVAREQQRVWAVVYRPWCAGSGVQANHTITCNRACTITCTPGRAQHCLHATACIGLPASHCMPCPHCARIVSIHARHTGKDRHRLSRLAHVAANSSFQHPLGTLQTLANDPLQNEERCDPMESQPNATQTARVALQYQTRHCLGRLAVGIQHLCPGQNPRVW